MNLATIRQEVQTRSGDTDFSANSIDRWVNFCIKQLVARADWPWAIKTLGTGTTTANTQEYSLPTDFKKMISVRVGTASTTSETDAEEYSFVPYISKNVSTDGNMFYLNPDTATYGLIPKPSTTGLPVYLKYYKIPADLASSDSPPFPETYHEAVVQFALQRYWESNDDYGKAAFHNAEYENMVDLMKSDLLVRATGQLTRVRDVRELVGLSHPQKLNTVVVGK